MKTISDYARCLLSRKEIIIHNINQLARGFCDPPCVFFLWFTFMVLSEISKLLLDALP